jgi:hypothetical protein
MIEDGDISSAAILVARAVALGTDRVMDTDKGMLMAQAVQDADRVIDAAVRHLVSVPRLATIDIAMAARTDVAASTQHQTTVRVLALKATEDVLLYYARAKSRKPMTQFYRALVLERLALKNCDGPSKMFWFFQGVMVGRVASLTAMELTYRLLGLSRGDEDDEDEMDCPLRVDY